MAALLGLQALRASWQDGEGCPPAWTSRDGEISVAVLGPFLPQNPPFLVKADFVWPAFGTVHIVASCR